MMARPFRGLDELERPLDRLQMSAGRGITVAQLAVQTGRPPEHLAAKARELGYDLVDGSQGAQDARYMHPFVDGNYLVHVGQARTVDVLARRNIQPYEVYRMGSWRFAANLSEREAEQLAADLGVRELEPGVERLAPHRRMPVETRVPGHYAITVRRTSRPLTVAVRVGVVPARIFYFSNFYVRAD